MQLPALSRPLSQPERELAVGAFLDVTVDQWLAWAIDLPDGPDGIGVPDELNAHLGNAVLGLRDSATAAKRAQAGDLVASAEVPGHYQLYLQTLALLSDSALVWTLRSIGTSPFPAEL